MGGVLKVYQGKLGFTEGFVESYHRLPQAIRKKVHRCLSCLVRDITYPGLRVRKMIGTNGIWEARVDARYRLTFERSGNTIHLRNIGKHDIYQHP